MTNSIECHQTYIYALADPRSGKIRYVGKSDNPNRRLHEHESTVRRKDVNTHFANWLRLLMDNELRPQILHLERVSPDHWQDAERDWIAALEQYGFDLTNSTPGGEGQPGGDQFPGWLRDKLREINSGKRHSRAQRAKIVEGMRRRFRNGYEVWNAGTAKPPRKRTCEKCGEGFRPDNNASTQRYCSVSCARTGKPSWNSGRTGVYSATTIEKIRQAAIGRKPSKVAREKMSLAQKARLEQNPKALGDFVAFGRAALRNRRHEVNQKISNALTGKKKSAEHRKSLSVARKELEGGPS